ncbi:hypothetical protein [Acinetobacter sp. TAC-1]|uniref:hypothetical protein n=1 Tax=Acinetobacter sp. TAC-1 TaxID=3027470 RepID=UPI0023AAC984|nr:hypothetical protein [Acinetobacter sp. TAC-1]WEE38583.1 hypothetical protein PYV58_16850 [Acinetobacter sp. TAC-1]
MISASHARSLQTDVQKVQRLGIIAETKILETIKTGNSRLFLSIAKQLYSRQEVKQLIINLSRNGFEVIEEIRMGSEDSTYYKINIWW